MALFYFRSEIHQFLVSSANLTEALNAFSQGLKKLYGETLQGWSVNAEKSVTVQWREEGETSSMKDLFSIEVLPENTAVCFNAFGLEPPTFVMPAQQQVSNASR